MSLSMHSFGMGSMCPVQYPESMVEKDGVHGDVFCAWARYSCEGIGMACGKDVKESWPMSMPEWFGCCLVYEWEIVPGEVGRCPAETSHGKTTMLIQ